MDRVAKPTVQTAAVLIPAIITGIASGNLTFTKTCVELMPIPLAASTTSDGTESRPVTVFLAMGNIE